MDVNGQLIESDYKTIVDKNISTEIKVIDTEKIMVKSSVELPVDEKPKDRIIYTEKFLKALHNEKKALKKRSENVEGIVANTDRKGSGLHI